MSLPPLPPSGNTPYVPPAAVSKHPRRPQVWVPPVIIFGAFAAGYAIPWDLGANPSNVLIRLIFPLLASAILCGIAGFYSYRTVPGWRTWTWIAFGVMALNGVQILLVPAMQMPLTVNLMIWISLIGILICAILGPEKNSNIPDLPSVANPGYRL